MATRCCAWRSVEVHDDARQNQNSVDVKLDLKLKATTNRTYPDLDVDDKVKIYKTKDKMDKDKTTYCLIKTYIVERISVSHNHKCYQVD